MDASVGLTFSLQLFQRYRRNGFLRAEIRHMPGIQGACTAYIILTTGSVTACYLEDKHRLRYSFAIEDLCRIDSERGPFEWTFQQQSSSPHSQAVAPSSARSPTNPSTAPPDRDASIPRIVAQMNWEQFNHLALEQKLVLQAVWQNIDGKRTVGDIKTNLPYPPQAVNDIIQILLTLHVIALAP